MATIALRNSPSWNCHPRLKRHPKRGKLWQHLGKSHALCERGRRNRARWRDSRIEEAYISTHVPCRDCASNASFPHPPLPCSNRAGVVACSSDGSRCTLTASALLSTATEPGIAEHYLRSSDCELVN